MGTGANGVCIVAKGVSRTFGSTAVLHEIDLDIGEGEFIAVVGRSGSGKTTLLKLLAGLDHPDTGDLRVGGAPVRGLLPQARVMFQDGRLLPWLRVGANVALGLPQVSRDSAKKLLARVGLADRTDDWPAVLSGGQRQRVALARSLAANPKLLLLDEPLGSLDTLTRIEMQRLIESVWSERGFTALLITHDVEEAVTLADRVVLLESGRIAAAWRVPFARPRLPVTPGFGALVQEVLNRILNGAAAPPLEAVAAPLVPPVASRLGIQAELQVH